ncbi:MAG: KUP/HAK/KT family potassium transporter [Dermatophilus congolensis]|nr:KUP/HAK/KT family potassium transporter [Dermatophilus congolensis]
MLSRSTPAGVNGTADTVSRSASHDGHGPQGAGAALLVGAIGVVFGDIGTSPLYSLQTVFSADHNAVRVDPTDIFGVISLVFWSVSIVVSIKYVALVMRADNDGEGGILALTALLRGTLNPARRASTGVILLGITGAALFYGDSLITPAISVMSAIEGIAVVNPHAQDLVLPISIVIIVALFAVQRWGTGAVGRAFGPVMVVWFGVLAAMGVPHIVANPHILTALSPHYALVMAVDRPFITFVALGAVVLTITGAEALYADMGHFGARPIKRAWFWVVFPALLLNYLGQGAMLLDHPETAVNPFFSMVSEQLVLPLVVLATMATVIASQAVISGAFSVSRQAVRLGLLPRLTVRHTSKLEGGQIYVPVINWLLLAGVITLIAVFRESAKLATAYGLAVTGTLLLTTGLFLTLAKYVWHWSWARIAVIGVIVGGAELAYLGANLTKVVHGGWLPLLIASVVIAVMTTWRRGAAIVTEKRRELEEPLEEYIARLEAKGVKRVPGTAVFPHADVDTAPLALRANVRPPFDLDPGTATYFLSVLSVRRAKEDPLLTRWRAALFVTLAHNSADRTQVFHLPPGRTVTMGANVEI